MQVETGLIAANLVSTSAPLLRVAPPLTSRAAAEFTLAQRAARVGLTILAIVAMSALYASQVAATLR